jgi:hypothetical protein
MKWERQGILQALGCLLCACLAWYRQLLLEGSEFSGGSLTGPLLNLSDIGSTLFVLALLLGFWRPRVAAAVVVFASIACLPLYLYLTMPRLFRAVFPGQYKVSLGAFGWDPSSTAGILSIVLALYLCYRRPSSRPTG